MRQLSNGREVAMIVVFVVLAVAGGFSIVLSAVDTLADAQQHQTHIMILRVVAAVAGLILVLHVLTAHGGQYDPARCEGNHCVEVRPHNWENLPRNDTRVVCDDRCAR